LRQEESTQRNHVIIEEEIESIDDSGEYDEQQVKDTAFNPATL
jgi:hypothetical protein